MFIRPIATVSRTISHWAKHTFTGACLLTVFACAEDEPDPPGAGELGSTCELEEDACDGELACTPDDQGAGKCTLPPGAECQPEAEGLDNGGCALSAECQSDGDEADAAPTCRILSGEDCDAYPDHCADELTCAELEAGGRRCFAPVQLQGTVTDTASGSGIEGAHVIAIDDQGSAASSVAVSDADGVYTLSVPVLRGDEGQPLDTAFTLRASAQHHQSFPFGARVALPIDVGQAEERAEAWVVDNALTAVGLIPLPEDTRYAISGVIEAGEDSDSDLTGVLVVAAGERGAFSATTDDRGAFTIFNVTDGDYTLRAYAAELQVTPEEVTVAGEPIEDLTLNEDEAGTVSVSGNIQIVNAPGGSLTSVILVVRDTFDTDAVRGEVPRGLRAPRAGVPDVSGDFVIEGVPDGDYVVLAAYENDELVRDPDENISGTDLVYISVSSGDGALEVSESFKVTQALEILAPGADQPEAVSGAPILSWADDSSEDYYELRVFDAFGDEVWSQLEIPGVSGSDMVSVEYEGPLEPGMYYQFRVHSLRQSGNQDASPISATEDLKGVFFRPAE